MSIEALLFFCGAVLLGLGIGALLGVAWGEEVRKRSNLLALLGLTAVAIFLASIISPPTLADIYRGLVSFNLATDWLVTGFVTTLFAGGVGVAAGLAILSTIEFKHVFDKLR